MPSQNRVLKDLLESLRNQTGKDSRYDCSSLGNTDITNQYTVRNKFDTQKETSDRHTQKAEHENLVTAYIETAIEHIPSKPTAKSTVCWESIAVRKKWGNIKKTILT